MSQYAPMVAGGLLMGSTTLVDQSMAAILGSGSVSALSYGNKIVAFVLGVGSLGLSTAVFPHFCRMVAVSDWIGVRYTLKTYSRLVLVVTVPFTLILIYFSESIVRLVFERGAFTMADTRIVGQVQAFYLLQVPFYMLGITVVRLISSLKANIVLMKAAFVNLFSNIILNYMLMQWLGIAGIALSTAIVYLISLIYCWMSMNKKLRDLG